jgi:hypothetical protein
MTTLLSQARAIVEQGCDRNINYNTLNDYQRDNLTALAIQDLAHPEEAIESVILDANFIKKIIETLQEQHLADRNVLLKELGQMLLDGATISCKEAVTDALDESVTELAVMRQFYDECGEYDYRNNRDVMKRAIYNHPEL